MQKYIIEKVNHLAFQLKLAPQRGTGGKLQETHESECAGNKHHP